MRVAWLALVVGCGTATSGTTGDSAADGACALAADHQTCPSCSDGPWTCTYDETTVTVASCGGCQARGQLYSTLCEAGENDYADTIEALTICEAVTCEVRNPCGCTPECVQSNTLITTVDCAELCDPPVEGPGTCAWTGTDCGWVK